MITSPPFTTRLSLNYIFSSREIAPNESKTNTNIYTSVIKFREELFLLRVTKKVFFASTEKKFWSEKFEKRVQCRDIRSTSDSADTADEFSSPPRRVPNALPRAKQ